MYYNILMVQCQQEIFEKLIDKSSSGRIRPWDKHKSDSLFLSDVYDYISSQYNICRDSVSDSGFLVKSTDYDSLYYKKRADAVYKCGDVLEFVQCDDDSLKLYSANFCKNRLCPMCAWRRSLKIYNNVFSIVNELQNKNYSYLLLTLTVPNCVGSDLSDFTKKILLAYHDMFRHSPFKNVIRGWYRALEITFNKCFNTFHPHIHAILVVDNDYFTSNKYITRDFILDKWRYYYGDDSITQVDIRTVLSDSPELLKKSVAEIAKYTVKSTDYLIRDDIQRSAELVELFDDVLYRRRLVAFGGIMKQIHKQLNLDDELDGDLTDVGSIDDVDRETLNVVTYFWHHGFNSYVTKK